MSHRVFAEYPPGASPDPPTRSLSGWRESPSAYTTPATPATPACDASAESPFRFARRVRERGRRASFSSSSEVSTVHQARKRRQGGCRRADDPHSPPYPRWGMSFRRVDLMEWDPSREGWRPWNRPADSPSSTPPNLSRQSSGFSLASLPGWEDRYDDALDINYRCERARQREVASARRPAPETLPVASESPTRRSPAGRFGEQYVASLQRLVLGYLHTPVVAGIHILAPVLFALFLVIIAYALGTENQGEINGLDYANLNQLTLSARPHQLILCADAGTAAASGKVLIPGLPSCAERFPEGYSCGGDESDLPVGGLCHSTGRTCDQVLGEYLASAVRSLSQVPDLDGIVALQWLARKCQIEHKLGPLLSLVMMGLILPDTLTSIIHSGDLHFAPQSEETKALVDHLNQTVVYFPFIYGGTHATLEGARAAVLQKNRRSWAIVEAKGLSSERFDVALHLNRTAIPALANRLTLLYGGGFNGAGPDLYISSGALSLQKTMYEYYLSEVVPGVITTSDEGGLTPFLSLMGIVPSSKLLTVFSATFIMACILSLGYLLPVMMMTKDIVQDKELRVEEAAMIMGMGWLPALLSRFTFLMLQSFFVSLLSTTILKIGVLKHSDPFVVLVIFQVYAISTITLSMFFASFFSKTQMASLMSPIAYFFCVIPIFAMNDPPGSVLIYFSILPPSCFSGILRLVLQHELRGGFQWADLRNPLDTPTTGLLLLILLGDTLLYGLLAAYLNAVLPKDCGVRRHPLFFLSKPIQFCCRRDPLKDLHCESSEKTCSDSGVYEEPNPHEEPSVVISGLHKVYYRHGKPFIAVKNLHLRFPSTGISVLLGRNGAGKSTLMAMLTGLTEPSAGDCLVYGKSIRHALTEVRQEIGFCPQHNILWPHLTCREHLQFYGRMKGLRGDALESAVHTMLLEIDLLDKKNTPAQNLSGGMKRKLSVAIAFVGGSPVVFLDEPTAGMDAVARRHTWELLKRMSVLRTIILTTHFMDEAELLGDQVAILHAGQLRCSGSSLFLKSRLGLGYSIVISLLRSTSLALVDRMVRKSMEGVEVVENQGTELIYHLPSQGLPHFPSLLASIEEKEQLLGIRGYAISPTSLEDIFLKVTGEAEGEWQQELSDSTSAPLTIMNESLVSCDSVAPSRSTSSASVSSSGREASPIWDCERLTRERDVLWQQLVFTVKKRCQSTRRDYLLIGLQIILPVFCVFLAMLFATIVPHAIDSIVLGDAYPQPIEIVASRCEPLFGAELLSLPQGTEYRVEAMRNSMDLNYYLMDTWHHHGAVGRYGSFSCQDGALVEVLKQKGILPDPSANTSTDDFQPIVFLHNSSSPHEAPTGIFHTYSGPLMRAKPSHPGLRTSMATLPISPAELSTSASLTALTVGSILMVPFTFLPASCVAWVVAERETQSRHLQHIAGMRFGIYWLGTFLFDMALYLVMMVCVLLIFVVFDRPEFVSKHTFGPTVMLFLTYGVCEITLAYACSFFFTRAMKAQVVVSLFSFGVGYLWVMAVSILNIVERTKDLSDVLRWIGRCLPIVCIGEGIVNLSMLKNTQLYDSSLTVWSMEVIGWPCVFMTAFIPLAVLFTVFQDHPRLRAWWRKRHYNASGEPEEVSGEDSDVEDERLEVLREIEAMHSSSDMRSLDAESVTSNALTLVHLRKVFPSGKVAVRDISFSVIPGEVFGFLGTNGAGKTTTMSILCQEHLPTSGQVLICGYDLVQEPTEALGCLGFCPQFGGTMDLLTVEEHLYHYAGIAGIVRAEHNALVQELLQQCGLVTYRHVLSGQLSGGNRRKLSLALALLGGPRVILLDEPSAGMDPVARREMWASIQAVRAHCSVILTTHHLEEIEALANCVTIMVNGALRCIGTKAHLKKKYGSGYEMHLRLTTSQHRTQVEEFIEDHLPGAVLREYRSGRLTYLLTKDTRLQDVFELLQSSKDALGVTDYSIAQASIEQVFMRISEGNDTGKGK